MAAMDAPATAEEEDAKITNELADHTPEDTIHFLEHCEDNLSRGEKTECCSPRMMAALKNKTAVDRKSASAAGAGAGAGASAGAGAGAGTAGAANHAVSDVETV